MLNSKLKSAAELHENVPVGWYFHSIKENILQRYWHKRRFEEVAKLIEPMGGKILDVGCADGVFTKVIYDKSHADSVVAIDVLQSSIDWAKKHWRRYPRIQFMVADAHTLPFKANSFNAAFALEMLEHVFKPEVVLNQIKRVLKRGGYAVFLVPSDSDLFKVVWFFWTMYRGKIWKDTHIQTYRDDYLPKVCKKVGFEIVDSKKFLLGMLHAVKVRKK